MNVFNVAFFKEMPLKILFIFRERGREGEREGNINVFDCVVASCAPPTGGLARNASMCADWE